MLFMLIFKRKNSIVRQIESFVDYKKSTKNFLVACQHKEWLVKFVAVTKISDVYEAKYDHVLYFKDWLYSKYPSDYINLQAMHSLRCFLKFYRMHDILDEMIRLGRKPDFTAIAKVKQYRSYNPPISYQKIAEEFSKEGRKVSKRQVIRWAYTKI